MSVRLSGAAAGDVDAEVFAVPVYSSAQGPVLGPTGGAGSGDLASAVEAGLRCLRGFRGAVGQIAIVPGAGPGPSVVAVGVGEQPSCGVDRLRAAAAALGSYLRDYPSVVTSLALAGTLSDLAGAIRAVVEGFDWGRFTYRAGGTEPDMCLTVLVGSIKKAGSPALLAALEVAVHASASVAWARTMVETPPSALAPAAFGERIGEQAAAAGVECRVWSTERIRQAGFGGTLGVGRGSVNAPAVVELTYPGDGHSQTWGLAGKGITFDSGGINLKRDADEISWMKSDMAGAAAVVAAVCAAARLGAARSVHAIVPLAENLPGPGALLPGDVVQHPDGSSTEVLDTDNEGRLVLADALAYLATQQVAAVIDVGTLTDGGGLGHLLWGCWGTCRELAEQLVAAGEVAGDPGWYLPLRAEYRVLFDSRVADRTNRARDVPDSATMAATFLRPFAAAVPWVHVDNGSTAYLDADLPPRGRGATGSPTLALLELLLANPAG